MLMVEEGVALVAGEGIAMMMMVGLWVAMVAGEEIALLMVGVVVLVVGSVLGPLVCYQSMFATVMGLEVCRRGHLDGVVGLGLVEVLSVY